MHFKKAFNIGVQTYLLDLKKNQSFIYYIKNIVLNEPLNKHTPSFKEHIILLPIILVKLFENICCYLIS